MGDVASQEKQKAGKVEKAGKAEKAPAESSDAEPSIDALELRVGKILSIDRHPNAESLYVEQIDLGEEKPRQVNKHVVISSSLAIAPPCMPNPRAMLIHSE